MKAFRLDVAGDVLIPGLGDELSTLVPLVQEDGAFIDPTNGLETHVLLHVLFFFSRVVLGVPWISCTCRLDFFYVGVATVRINKNRLK